MAVAVPGASLSIATGTAVSTADAVSLDKATAAVVRRRRLVAVVHVVAAADMLASPSHLYAIAST